MNNNSTGQITKGTATLEFRDATTGELLRTVEKDNTMTMAGDNFLTVQDTSVGNFYTVNGGGSPYNHSQMLLGNTNPGYSTGLRVCTSASRVSPKAYALWTIPSNTIGPNSIESPWTMVAPKTFVIRCRYSQPGTDKTISSIFLSGYDYYTGWTNTYTWIDLVTPCIQHTNEVLDITYRVQMLDQDEAHTPVNSDNMVWVEGYDSSYAASRWLTGTGTASSDISEGYYIDHTRSHWGKMPKKSTRLRNLFQDMNNGVGWSAPYMGGQAGLRTVANQQSRYLMTTLPIGSSALAAGDQVGKLIRVGQVCRNTYDLTWNGKVWGMTPWLPSNYQYQPVQPIHNHNKNAPTPFVDINNLATGAGSLSILPGSWTETNGLLEWWRMDVMNTGQTGTARYALSKNVRVSFAGNDYHSGGVDQDAIPHLNCNEGFLDGLSGSNTNAAGVVTYPGKSSMVTAHYRGNKQNILEWITTKHIISHDDTGVTFIDIVSSDYTNFDALSTPALNLANIRQAVSLSDGTLYVADAVVGLWKIVDPLGTPVVSKIASVLTNMDTNKCYAVFEGYSNSLWAVFEGGLANSTDGGATWLTYTAQNGGWTHSTLPTVSGTETITATTNWSTIKMGRSDIEQSDNRVGLIRSSPSTGSMLTWWKAGFPAVDVNIADNTFSNTWMSTNILSGDTARTNFFKCSRRGGMWILYNVEVFNGSNTPVTSGPCSVNDGVVTVLKHMGSATVNDFRRGYNPYGPVNYSHRYSGAMPLIGVSFLYDNNNKPYYCVTGTTAYLDGYYGTPVDCKLFTDTGEGHGIANRIYGFDNYIANGWGNWLRFFAHPNKNCFSWERARVEQGYRGPSLSMRAHVGSGARLSMIQPNNWYPSWNNPATDTTMPLTDSWTGRHSPIREFNWSEYRWNGSAWADGFHAPLVDSSANTHNGIRAGFEAESHTFRGRSKVDVSSVLSENFTTGMTLVGTFTATAPRYLGLMKQHVLWSTDKFQINRNDSDSTTSPGQIGLKYRYDINFPGATVAVDTATRYVTTVTSTANTSYDFKQDTSNQTNRGNFMRPVDDTFVSRKSVVIAAGSETYRTLYSPVYTPISGGDFAVRFKANIPTVTGPGGGLRIGVRYGALPFTSALDTYFSTTGTVDYRGFRSATAFTVLLAGGTTAPVFVNNLTTLTSTQNNAMTVNDHNLTNKLELRFAISGANLVITLVRIETAGVGSNVTLATCTVTGAGTTYSGKPGIIGITPEFNGATLAAQTNYHKLEAFELYDYVGATAFGKTAYTSTVNVYADGNSTPLLTYAVGTDVPLNTPNELVLGFDTLTKWRGLWGSVANPQVWNVAWNSGDLTADFSALTASSSIDTTNAPTAALKVKYLMTQSIVEGKPTHTAAQNSTNAGGMSLQFGNAASNGSSTFAFVGTDFYSWGMYTGMLKDNAISASFTNNLIIDAHVIGAYNKLTSPLNLNALATTIANVTTTPVTELAVFGTNTTTYYGPGFTAAGSGYMGGNYTQSIMEQSLPASTDGWIEAGINRLAACFVGLTTQLTGAAYPANSNATTGAFIQLNLDGSYVCKVNNVVLFTSAVGAYTLEDKIKIERVNSATTPEFRFYFKGVQVASTTTGVQTGELAACFVGMAVNPTGFHEIKINYVRDFPCLDIGQYNADPAVASGKYSPRFLKLQESAPMFDLKIDGTPAIILFHATTMSQLPAPASIPSGTVYVIAKHGIIAFSSADIGKAVTLGSAPMLYWK